MPVITGIRLFCLNEAADISMEMKIRKAIKEDAEVIAVCLLLAMEEIVYRFIGKRDPEEAKAFMLHFTSSEDNQYSYQCCWVVEQDDELVGAANIYDGVKLHQLREPVLAYILQHYGRRLQPEDETGPGEFYLDSLGILPIHQGKGIGAAFLRHLIDEYTVHRKESLGLLVDEDNPSAKRLYLRLGFQAAGIKSLMGKRLEHLQIQPLKE